MLRVTSLAPATRWAVNGPSGPALAAAWALTRDLCPSPLPLRVERVPGHLQRDLIVTAEAPREQRQRRRLGPHPLRRPHLARLRDRHLTEVAMDVQPNETHRTTSTLGRYRRRRGGRHDNYGSVRTAHPDSRRGGHLQTTGSQPIMSRGLPNPRVSLKPLASGTRRRYGTARTTQTLHRGSFISLHEHRPHRSLEQRPPCTEPSNVQPMATVIALDRIRRRVLLGGLIHEYRLAA
jgi:hypothetical protein